MTTGSRRTARIRSRWMTGVPWCCSPGCGEHRCGTAVLTVRGASRFRRACEPQRPATLAELRLLRKAVNATVADERHRLDQALVEQRHWSFPEWVRLYATHPLTSLVTLGALWSIDAADGAPSHVGRVGRDGLLYRADGSTEPLGKDAPSACGIPSKRPPTMPTIGVRPR